MKAGMDTARFGVHWRSLAAIIVVSISVGLYAVVSSESNGAPVENAPRRFSEQIEEIRTGGGSRRIHDLIPGSWTTVHVFDMESLVRESVEKDVGYSLDMPETYLNSMGALFVFVDDDSVVRAAAVYTSRFNEYHSTGDTDSMIEFDSTTGYFRLK